MAVGTNAAAETGKAVPGLAGVPLLGSLFDLKSDSLGTYLRAQHQHGDLVRITAGPPGMRAELYCVFSPRAPSRCSPPTRPVSARTTTSTKRSGNPSATGC